MPKRPRKKSPAELVKMGRPTRPPFTREEIDAAKGFFGRHYYASRVVDALTQKFADLGRDAAYRLIDVAKAETAKELADISGNPLVTIYLGFCALAFGEKVNNTVRVQALNGMVKLLGVKAIKDLSDTGDIEKFLSDVAARSAARSGGAAGENPNPPPPKTEGSP